MQCIIVIIHTNQRKWFRSQAQSIYINSNIMPTERQQNILKRWRNAKIYFILFKMKFAFDWMLGNPGKIPRIENILFCIPTIIFHSLDGLNEITRSFFSNLSFPCSNMWFAILFNLMGLHQIYCRFNELPFF